jgi:hypothetical protein
MNNFIRFFDNGPGRFQDERLWQKEVFHPALQNTLEACRPDHAGWHV